MTSYRALSEQSASIWTRIRTPLVYASTIQRTFWTDDTFRATMRWSSDVIECTRAHCLLIKLFTLTVRSTWRWEARIPRCYSCGYLREKKNPHNKYKQFAWKHIYIMCVSKLRVTTMQQQQSRGNWKKTTCVISYLKLIRWFVVLFKRIWFEVKFKLIHINCLCVEHEQ